MTHPEAQGRWVELVDLGVPELPIKQCPPVGFIYVITNTVNDKKYVGKTTQPEQRFYVHEASCLKNSSHHQRFSPLYCAMRKYGLDKFTFNVVETYPSGQDALDVEDDWIEKFQSRVSQHGYNVAPGGGASMLGCKRSIESIEKSRRGLIAALAGGKQDRINTVLKLHLQGLLGIEISSQTGFCADLVIKIIREAGLQSNGLTAENLAKAQQARKKTMQEKTQAEYQEAIPVILAMRNEGKTQPEIRQHLRISTNFIGAVLKQNGLNRLPPKKKSQT
jgi:group I intron endonuclease